MSDSRQDNHGIARNQDRTEDEGTVVVDRSRVHDETSVTLSDGTTLSEDDEFLIIHKRLVQEDDEVVARDINVTEYTAVEVNTHYESGKLVGEVVADDSLSTGTETFDIDYLGALFDSVVTETNTNINLTHELFGGLTSEIAN
jgi:hypothetical protein